MLTSVLIKWGLIALLSGGAVLFVYSKVSDYFLGVANTRQTLANERILRERAEVSLASEVAARVQADAHQEMLDSLRQEHQDAMNALRDKADKDKDVLIDRERLTRLSLAKPGLVEKLGNAATRKRFEEIEHHINSD